MLKKWNLLRQQNTLLLEEIFENSKFIIFINLFVSKQILSGRKMLKFFVIIRFILFVANSFFPFIKFYYLLIETVL